MSEQVIQLDKNKCKACYSCIRACPVKAIQVKRNSVFPHIDESKCIHCGVCLPSCVYNALYYYDSTTEVKKLLNSDYKIAAICAPAIAGEFSDINDYRKFVKMIRMLGFSYVNEMSFGVDMIARKFKELIEDHFKGKYYITSNCPSIVDLIQKFYPELIGNLVPYISPAAASAIVIRKLYGESVKVVHITPCVAAKEEARKKSKGIDKIDAVLTFQELRTLFDEFKIKETFSEFSDFDAPLGYKGRLYPISQGFIEACHLETNLLEGKTITVEGKENALAAIHQFIKHNEDIHRHFNIFFCEGCIMGPGNSTCGDRYLKHTLVLNYIKKRLTHFDIHLWKKNMDAHLNYPELTTQFNDQREFIAIPSELEIKATLDRITQRNNKKEVNCGACGYGTCRGLATAIAQNIAIPEMCVTNAQLGNREVSHEFKMTMEELTMAKNDLKKTKESLKKNEQTLSFCNEALSILIKKLNTGIVLANEHLKVIECNIGFIDVLGDDVKEIHEVIPYLVGADLNTLLPTALITQLNYLLEHNEANINRDVEIDKKLINVSMFQLIPNKLVGALFRNLHSKEERPEEIIHRVNEIIEENLRQVQQMGFILGEGAAKMEKMLNSIIKSYK